MRTKAFTSRDGPICPIQSSLSTSNLVLIRAETDGCGDDDCVETKYCDSVTCSFENDLIDNAEQVACDYDPCSEVQCCEPVCGYMPCPNICFVGEDPTTPCGPSGCTVDLCCNCGEPLSRCSLGGFCGVSHSTKRVFFSVVSIARELVARYLGRDDVNSTSVHRGQRPLLSHPDPLCSPPRERKCCPAMHGD